MLFFSNILHIAAFVSSHSVIVWMTCPGGNSADTPISAPISLTLHIK